MEFHEKLQELRKQKGLTQEELAQSLFVSRAAISKWESGRGYPKIESLKTLSKFYGVTIDALLSGEEALSLAEASHREKENHFRRVFVGLLDLSVAMFLFMPFFGQSAEGKLYAVSLLAFTGIGGYLRTAYLGLVAAMVLTGVLTLSLGENAWAAWEKQKYRLSLGLNAVAVLLFIVSRQPYAAAYLFLCLAMKGYLCQKQR